MRTREDVIKFCLTLANVYEDYPFTDHNWTLIRHKGNKKSFATVYHHIDCMWLNVKCDPNLAYMWRHSFESVIPAYHMNKEHWNSIILDGTVPTDVIKSMIIDSFEMTKPKKKIRG